MIGSALADFCADRGVEVLAIVNPNSKRLDTVEGKARITVVPIGAGEYEDFAAGPVAAKMPRCDVFYHFAWDGTLGAKRADEERQRFNVGATLSAVRLAQALGCERFVFAGSQAEYGKLEGPFGPDTPCRPTTPYGRAKRDAGKQSRELARELGLEHIHARIGSVYGPGDNDGTVLIQAIWHAWHDEPFACTPGEQLWDHIYCDDAADAFFRMGESGKDGAVYAVGTGQAVPLREHIQMACEVCNPEFTPDFGALPYPEGQVMHLQADIGNLQQDTGFEPFVPFEEGIKRTAEWYRETLTRQPLMPWERHGGLDNYGMVDEDFGVPDAGF